MYEEFLAEATSSLQRIHDDLVAAANAVQFDPSQMRNPASIAQFYTIVVLAGDACALVKHQRLTTLPLVLRQMLESVVDLKNTCRYANYWKYLIHDTQNFMESVRREFRELNNPNFADLENILAQNGGMAQMMRNKKVLQADGIKKLSIKEKFKMAGMEYQYGEIYRFLCLSTHNGLAALLERHSIAPDHFNQLAIYKPAYPGRTETFVLMFIGYLLDAANELNKQIGNPFKEVCDTAQVNLTKLRADWYRISHKSEPVNKFV